MVRGTGSPTQWLLDLRAYGLKIHYSSTAVGHVDWKDNQTLGYKSLSFSMDRFRQMVHELRIAARQLLFEELLFAGHAEQVPRCRGRRCTTTRRTARSGGISSRTDARNGRSRARSGCSGGFVVGQGCGSSSTGYDNSEEWSEKDLKAPLRLVYRLCSVHKVIESFHYFLLPKKVPQSPGYHLACESHPSLTLARTSQVHNSKTTQRRLMNTLRSMQSIWMPSRNLCVTDDDL